MSRNRKCVWHDGQTYRGKRGGLRRVVRQDRYTVTIEVIEDAGSAYPAGAVMTVQRESMKRWTANDQKQYGDRGES